VGLVGRAGLVVIVGVLVTIVGACGEDGCPPDASSCPEGCGAIEGYGANVERHCIINPQTVGCLEPPKDRTLGGVIMLGKCIVRVRDGAVLEVTAAYASPLVETGAWRFCRENERGIGAGWKAPECSPP
jgi:hypothetical protein